MRSAPQFKQEELVELMKKLKMSHQMLIATAVGILLGVLFGEQIQPLKIVGDIFLRLLQMSVMLVILGHIIEAVAINPKDLAKLGLKIIAGFLIFAALGATWGWLMGTIFNPGGGVDLTALGGADVTASEISSISDTILGFFPTNVVGSMAQGTIMHAIVFGVLFGIAASQAAIQFNNRVLLDGIVIFNKTIIRLMSNVMTVAPIGICILLATTIGRLGVQVMLPLLKFLLVYGLATLTFWILVHLVVSAICKMNPIKLAQHMTDMSLMAAATGSSAITLPTVMKDCKEKIGLSAKLTQLIMPLGVAICSPGAAMHMSIITLCVAQMYGVSFGPGQYIYIIALAGLASMANAVMPGAGILSLTIMVTAMGLPMQSIALFASVEWFIGIYRTVLNVSGDVYVGLLIGKTEGELDYSIFNGASKSA